MVAPEWWRMHITDGELCLTNCVVTDAALFVVANARSSNGLASRIFPRTGIILAAKVRRTGNHEHIDRSENDS